MGSGTTLLRLVLDSHPNIAIPQETGFMRAYNAHRFIPFKWSGRNWAKRLGWSRRELDEQLRVFYDTLFMRYVERHGKQRWGEKTPIHTFHVDAMARLFPDAVFVGISRHPGGNVASNMNRWKLTLRRTIEHYDRYNREVVRQAAKRPDRFVLMRYEDLVLHPEPVLRELLEWLGEPWADEVLQHHVVQGSRKEKEMVEGRNRPDDPLDTSRIAKWTTSIDDRARATLRHDLGRLGEFLGYSIDDPHAFAPLADGRRLATGADVAARIERFADLDLHTPGAVPRFEQLYHPREWTLTPVEQQSQVRRAILVLVRAATGPAFRLLPEAVRGRLRPLARRVGG